MGAEASRSSDRTEEVVVVGTGKKPVDDVLDPIMQRLVDIKSVLPLLASGQVSWQDQIETELDISEEEAIAGESLSSVSTAETLKLFKAWLQVREREISARQQATIAGVNQTEALAVQAMKGATRAAHFARGTASDLKSNAGALEVELRRAKNLVKGAVDSYARLVAVLENASFVPYSSSFSALASPTPRSSLHFHAPVLPHIAAPLAQISASGAGLGSSSRGAAQ